MTPGQRGRRGRLADDKAIYPFVGDMIRFYLSEEPLLHDVKGVHLRPSPVTAAMCWTTWTSSVVKAVNESGGYGMLMGAVRQRQGANRVPRQGEGQPALNYIGQPVVALSTCPTWTDEGLAPRHVDLRPYIVSGKSTWVLPGGLTRTALVKGSLVVNSSQGGGGWRTPGSWRTANDLPRCRTLLLDEPLPGTRPRTPLARAMEVNQTLLLDLDIPRGTAVEAAAHHQRHPRQEE